MDHCETATPHKIFLWGELPSFLSSFPPSSILPQAIVLVRLWERVSFRVSRKITEVTRPWENMVNVLYVMNGSMVKFITADRANYEVIKHLSERAALSRPGTSLQ